MKLEVHNGHKHTDFTEKILFGIKSMRICQNRGLWEYFGKYNTDFCSESAKQPYWTPEENWTCIPFKLPEIYELIDRSGGMISCGQTEFNEKVFLASDSKGSNSPLWPDTKIIFRPKFFQPNFFLFLFLLSGVFRIETNINITGNQYLNWQLNCIYITIIWNLKVYFAFEFPAFSHYARISLSIKYGCN